jgi:hypothetical protein
MVMSFRLAMGSAIFQLAFTDYSHTPPYSGSMHPNYIFLYTCLRQRRAETRSERGKKDSVCSMLQVLRPECRHPLKADGPWLSSHT